MSDSYSFLSKNFVLSDCKGTKKMQNRIPYNFQLPKKKNRLPVKKENNISVIFPNFVNEK